MVNVANKKLNIRKVRELLRLRFQQKLSKWQAAKTVGIGKTAASEYISGLEKWVNPGPGHDAIRQRFAGYPEHPQSSRESSL